MSQNLFIAKQNKISLGLNFTLHDLGTDKSEEPLTYRCFKTAYFFQLLHRFASSPYSLAQFLFHIFVGNVFGMNDTKSGKVDFSRTLREIVFLAKVVRALEISLLAKLISQTP